MTDSPEPGPEDLPEPANLRFLRRLVTVLTAVMIGGIVAVVVLLYTRFDPGANVLPALPETIALPQGAQAQAVTFGPGWVAVVTVDGRILVYDSASGALRQSITPE